MRLNERNRSVLALALLAATIGGLLFAAPAASRSRQDAASLAPGSKARVPAGVAAVAADAVRSDAPTAEAAVMRRAASAIRHKAWLARRVKARSAPATGTRTHGASQATAGGGSVREMVIALFSRIAGPGQVGMALCVANRESSFNPYARNPYSSAAGVFQWVSSSWASYSHRYGYGGASVFNAYANIAVAAHAVRDGGWGPWGGGCW